MRILTLVLFAFSTLGVAAQEVKTGPYSGKCGQAYPLGMVVQMKLGESRYLVAQNIGFGTRKSGIIETTKTTLGAHERVNMMLAYVKTEDYRGEDGFNHKTDVWRECESDKTELDKYNAFMKAAGVN